MKTKRYVAKQAYNFEKEVHGDCLSCGKDIVHPICPCCITKGFGEWMKWKEGSELGVGSLVNLKNKLDVFVKGHRSIKGESKKCVSCGKNVHVCPYCFTEYLYKLIKEAGVGVRLMSEFLFLFNFDFEHKGYYQELEAYGGW